MFPHIAIIRLIRQHHGQFLPHTTRLSRATAKIFERKLFDWLCDKHFSLKYFPKKFFFPGEISQFHLQVTGNFHMLQPGLLKGQNFIYKSLATFSHAPTRIHEEVRASSTSHWQLSHMPRPGLIKGSELHLQVTGNFLKSPPTRFVKRSELRLQDAISLSSTTSYEA